MHPELNHLLSQQRIEDMRHQADCRRRAKDVLSEGAPDRRRRGVARLFARLAVMRAGAGSVTGHTTEVSRRLTHEAPAASDVAVARGDGS